MPTIVKVWKNWKFAPEAAFPWKNKSATPITLNTAVSLILMTNSFPVAGKILRNTWGITTLRIVCPWVIPIACAASNCPLSTAKIPPRTISDI